MNVILIIAIVLSMIYAFGIILNFLKNSLEQDICTYKKRIEVLENYVCILQNNNTVLEQENRKLKMSAYFCIDEDLKYAVKYAMKKSHPDNGGNKEDFNRFARLYKNIK